MFAARLGGDLGFAVTWILAVFATGAGLLAWRRSGWTMGWAPIVALVGFDTVWRSVLLSLGVLTGHGVWRSHGGALSSWLPFVWRSVVGDLPLLVALVSGAMLAWSSTRTHEGWTGRRIEAEPFRKGPTP